LLCGLISREDQLLFVDGNDVRNMSIDDIADLIIGPVGETVKLRFARGRSRQFEVTNFPPSGLGCISPALSLPISVGI
jgi:C-terminal processing protease CtpA/Prc